MSFNRRKSDKEDKFGTGLKLQEPGVYYRKLQSVISVKMETNVRNARIMVISGFIRGLVEETREKLEFW